MQRMILPGKWLAGILTLSLLLMLCAGPTAHAGKDPDVEPCVKFAKTWEAAVAEAKLLNVPIVVHSHGFT
jgi:hypothetical protein